MRGTTRKPRRCYQPTRCPDCGAEGERRGHQECAYPSDAEDARDSGLERWARRYDELNGAPESETDR